ncbi:MAG: helix-turn-helix domain-containing protein [Microbacterium sp.]
MREVARRIGRAPSTVSRELRRDTSDHENVEVNRVYSAGVGVPS